MEKEVIVTADGLAKLREELDLLKTVRRKEVAERIKTAREFGDISENSEYDEAMNEQAFLEGRIKQIEGIVKKAIVVTEDEITTDVVGVGTAVKVFDYDFDEEVLYRIVGSAEADPINYKISNESPVGSSLMGKKVGDVVKVAVPDGFVELKILAIDKA